MSNVGTWVGVAVAVVTLAVSVTVPEVRGLIGLSAGEGKVAIHRPGLEKTIRLSRDFQKREKAAVSVQSAI